MEGKMPNQHQTTENHPKTPKRDQTRTTDKSEPIDNLMDFNELLNRPSGMAGISSTQAHAQIFHDNRFSESQRSTMATYLGQVGGNNYLQRVIEQVKSEEKGNDRLSLRNGPSVQREAGRRQPRWRPQSFQPELMERLLAPNSPLWRQLNPDSTSELNCPATAAGVDEFLGTGAVNPAPAGGPLSEFEFRVEPWSRPTNNFGQIRNLLSRANTFLVIEATRSLEYSEENQVTRQHWYVIVNFDGRIFGVDAYGEGEVINDLNSFNQEEGFSSYRYYRGAFRVTHINPADTLNDPFPEEL